MVAFTPAVATTRSAHKEVRAWPGVPDNLAVVNELDRVPAERGVRLP
jgi:hypothetical protein